ncbi:sulfatase-like hydrolase/transferase [Wenyingzhuangia aestuarii]|uniref:sulfatase-like hydrolase/transferase n=1 Tax=Wenyingzhuangia aestuarii TaxID=1647582 RepID=UPI0014394C80|nr:sulfatase [Wenyingzhuangia aestuarii]NJB83465.1 arylsulfatase A-like enzyme [Wenyingzhuangia aestuarii]
MNKRLILFTILVFQGLTWNKINAQTTDKPNIVWVVSEDNSKHYMSLFDEHGVAVPNIEALAKDGLTYTRAFSNTPVCSAARSTLISGSYGPRLASHYHRRLAEVPLPEGVQMYPAYLKQAGYYTVNNAKEDYNIIKPDGVWDVSSKKGTWRNRKKGQPFFYVHNIGTTHEGHLHFSKEYMESHKTKNNPETVFVQPNHPQTELFKYTNAFYRDDIQRMDKEVGDVVAKLKEDGLLENTFIFYYGDHGGVLPGSKGYINEVGVHVPLVVYIPSKYQHLADAKKGSKVNGFVNFIDFGPTIMNLAGVKTPKGMDGKPFLGKGVTAKEVAKRDETFSYADRFDEKYDMVRAVRKGKYKYIRNYQPFNFDGLMNDYRYKQLAYQEWYDLYKQGKLNKIQSQFFETKPLEGLYDVENDPFETNNLADNPEYAKTLKSLRKNLIKRELCMPDLSFYPEFYLIKHAFKNPVKFGQDHKKDIKRYLKIANLSLLDYSKAAPKLKKALESTDPWGRYWALIVCSSFKNKAKDMIAVAKKIANNDNEQINRVRAAEFLGLIKVQNPVNVMTNALYGTKDSAEALLILNSIVLMQDGYNYSFTIQTSKIDVEVANDKQVIRRLAYLSK